ncbi:AraC family transcriptional regulator [Streptomyces longisporoflavus]|uniref:AraC-like ligand-binding domain-containing protein n=1 Tax=Streptomyces longisporoflavus TaxID=28044 RepID=UPI00167CDCF7|nr:helix-turn-helix domain-containing protein [Streptomyces longisporoflavus]GGV72979.1 AraC family transcriptional regulator [Streptomyces longisporoflavus]
MLKKVFDSAELQMGDRVDAWHESVARAMVPFVMSIDQPAGFRASLRVEDLGAAQVNAVTYSSLRTQRTPKLIRRCDPEQYAVALTLRGRPMMDQAGRQTEPGVGNLMMYSTSWPYDGRADADDGTSASIVAQLPRALLPFAAREVDRLLATRLPGREGTGALLALCLTHLATDTSMQRPGDSLRLGTVLLDLITAFLAHHLQAETAVPHESRQRILLLQIKEFIHRHLNDPDLTPQVVAAAHHVSLRQVYKLFEGQGQPIAAWIKHQRLERCRRDLIDPWLHSSPVHAIAARWGFMNNAHFSRAFRAAYGLPPRDYRALALHAPSVPGPSTAEHGQSTTT